jgi:pimeloyl-ACP methyl ester carboxylesterase
MTPLVLLPGMMCDARLFGPQIEAFSSVMPLHLAPITAFDTIQALAAEVLAQAPARFNLAGLSMGGIVAMEIMAQAPQRVTRLALMDTNPRAETPERQQAREPQINKVRAGQLAAVMRDELKPNYLVDSPRKPAILDICMAMASDLGDEVFERQSLALQHRPDQQETLRRVTIPTLLLCGAEDQLCPRERHLEMLELIPGSRLEVIIDAGHMPTLEQPRATNTALKRWMEE